MITFKGKIKLLDDLLIIEDEEIGPKHFDDWITDVYSAIGPEYNSIEVRLKLR